MSTSITSTAQPATAYRRALTLGLLTAAYAVSFLDRQILSILQEPVKRDLALSDAQLGLLTGTAFAFFYVLAGVPLGRLVDRSARSRVISVSLALWSVMTALSGAAQNFWLLALTRVGVGVGEAGCNPAAHSMISDLYKPAKRAGAMAIYSSGNNIGILVGFLAGGLLTKYMDWRWVLVLAGVPGLLLALVFRVAVPEPVRGAQEGASTGSETLRSLRDVWHIMWSQPAIRQLLAALALSGFVGYSITSWSASVMIRSHGATLAQAGTWLACASGIGGAIGLVVAGQLANRFARRSPNGCLIVAAATSVLVAVGIALALMAATRTGAFLWLFLPCGLGAAFLSPSLAALHGMVPANARGTASSILSVVVNVAGLGVGPLVIGRLSDVLAGSAGSDSLRQACLWLVPAAALWAAVHYLFASRAAAVSRAALVTPSA